MAITYDLFLSRAHLSVIDVIVRGQSCPWLTFLVSNDSWLPCPSSQPPPGPSVHRPMLSPCPSPGIPAPYLSAQQPPSQPTLINDFTPYSSIQTHLLEPPRRWPPDVPRNPLLLYFRSILRRLPHDLRLCTRRELELPRNKRLEPPCWKIFSVASRLEHL